MRNHSDRRSNRRGATLAFISVALFMVLGFGALSIDLASLRSARSEAQRAADAIALAGASAFRDFPDPSAPETSDSARSRALELARVTRVRADTLDVRSPTWRWTADGEVMVAQTSDVTLNVIPDSQKVRAWVRRAGVTTFFGGLLAKPYGHVQAMAAAWASNSGPTVECLKPFVIPDMWYESNKVSEDVNGNNYMEPQLKSPGKGATGESWKFEPAAIGGEDYYLPYDPSVENDPLHPQTGYGSGLRSGYPGDVGLPMLIKPQTGGGNDPGGDAETNTERMGNSAWLLDFTDANVYDEIVSGCANARIGDSVPYESGGHVGGTKHGIGDLIKLDEDATWNPTTKQVENSDPKYGDWTRSPRVITIGLISPEYWIANSKNSKPDPGSVFSNFARMFLVDVFTDKSGNDNIQAIFLGTAPGGSGGTVAGSLVKTLQLIQ